MLPGLSGYKVCERLRAEENWVPVLILSAKDGEYDQADGLDLGADDYLTKPFSYVVLAARLRALLRRGAAPRPGRAAGRRPVARPRHPGGPPGRGGVELTAREFALLEYLMRRAGQVVSKSELLEHVWDAYDAIATSTSSRCTSATCGARSTRRSGGARCRRCAAPATGWPPTAAEGPAAGEVARPARLGRPGGRLIGPWPSPPRWWRRRGLRARVTMTAALGLAVALAAVACCCSTRCGLADPRGGRQRPAGRGARWPR